MSQNAKAASRQQKLLIYIAILLVCLVVGGDLPTYIFSGVITLISFVAAVESIPLLKTLVYKMSALFEVAILVFGIYAKINFGVTIAMALMFAGIGYTLVYRPYLHSTYNLK